MSHAVTTKICKQCRAEVVGEDTHCPYDGWPLETLPPDPFLGNKKFNGKYEIQSVLGKGGMSIVYKAKDVFMDRTVAIKILHTHLVSDNISIQRFRQEAQAAGYLNHPNIITVYDFGVTPEDQAFLIMECFEGPTLAQVLDDNGRITPERGLRIFRQICDGLEHAHKKGVVHRDLKPSNLCLVKSEDGTEIVKIVDFGIAKLLPQEGKQRQQLTQTGQIFGSPLFMSPEQCQGKDLDARSDLYSVGCLMYEALSGVPPFMGPTAFDTMTMHINDTPKPLKRTVPDVNIPTEIEMPIMRLLEKNPAKRYQSAGELKADLPPLPEEIASGTKVWKPTWYGSITHNPAARTTIISSLSALVVSGLIFCFWTGPEGGTPLQRTQWWVYYTLAEFNRNNHRFHQAKTNLKNAQGIASYLATVSNYSDTQRLVDTYLLEAHLGTDPNLPADFGDGLKYATAANHGIAVLLDERADALCKKERETLENIADMKVSADEKKKIVESRTGRVQLVARELAARSKYIEEEELLQQALAVDSKVLGEKHERIAELKLLLADCYLQMQLMPLVKPLLEEAYAAYGSVCGKMERRTIEALLKLGQFNRDRSNFAEAKAQLELALQSSKDLYKQSPENIDLLVEALASKADFCFQLRESDDDEMARESKKLYDQALKLHTEAIKVFGTLKEFQSDEHEHN